MTHTAKPRPVYKCAEAKSWATGASLLELSLMIKAEMSKQLTSQVLSIRCADKDAAVETALVICRLQL